MTWDIKLIALYYWVCDCFAAGAASHAQRHSKNVTSLELDFTDEEAITMYLFGLDRGHRTVKAIHQYAEDHLRDWFPTLPSYQKYNERLNFLNTALFDLCCRAMHLLPYPIWLIESQQMLDTAIDSMPIILAQGKRVDQAKVATELANKGWCASKNMWYHGLKLHVLGLCRPSSIPMPVYVQLSKASEHDNTIFKEQIAPHFSNIRVYTDKIYHDEAGIQELRQHYGLQVLPCQKRKKNQENLYADQKIQNTIVSRIRQPIESFFNWLNHYTDIQNGSKIRSTKGLFKHIYGRLTAALLLFIIF